jgi:hypothetical protein
VTDDLVVALGLVAAMLAATGMVWRAIFLGRASREWPNADGRVLDLEVKSIQRRHGSGSYRPTVCYAYTVGDREYRGWRIRFTTRLMLGTQSFTQAEARAELDDYFPGAAVAVYFDPRRPARSVLRPGASPAQYFVGWALGVGTVLVAAALWLVFASHAR